MTEQKNKLVLEGDLIFRDIYHEMYAFLINGDNLTIVIKEFFGDGQLIRDSRYADVAHGKVRITIERLDA